MKHGNEKENAEHGEEEQRNGNDECHQANDGERRNDGNNYHNDAPCGALEPEEADDATQHSDAQHFGA